MDGSREMEEEKLEEMMAEEWGENGELDEDGEEDEEERNANERLSSIQWGGEDIVQPGSKVRRRTFFDIFEDVDQFDEGESLHRDITIILILWN